MRENVYFLKSVPGEDDAAYASRLGDALEKLDAFGFIEDRDIVAVKTHFGETRKSGYIRPPYLRAVGDRIRAKGGVPFLTETSTLYRGRRNNAISHLALVSDHGFGYEHTGMPAIMADGLMGDEEIEVEVPGKIHRRVKIASLLAKVQALVVMSHFTGHLGAGFGAALKNTGMGLASRRGKLAQHSTARPSINKKACTRCGMCVRWCPEDAISMNDESALINSKKCVGCGQCLAVCRFDAVKYNWGATYEDLQKNVVEHAWGAHLCVPGKSLYLNFLTRISKDCDCMTVYEQITPDIGVLISGDPVAVDAASLDLVERHAGKRLSALAYDIPYRHQIDYARELGFGNPDYGIVEISP